MSDAEKKKEHSNDLGGGTLKSSQPPAKASPEEGLAANLQAHIGRQLRAAFDEIAREPVPDRFLQLLKDLERNEEDK
jgi:hypothetical protein